MSSPPTRPLSRLAASMADRRGALIVLGIIIAAFLAFGVIWVLAYPGAIARPAGDGVNYEATAKQLLTRGFYGYRKTEPNAGMSPGYPLFLTAIYAVTGRATRPPGINGGPYRLIYWIQLLFAAGSIALTYLIGSELLGRTRGLIAALLITLFPPMQQSALKLLTEPLAMLLFLGYVYVQLLALRRDRKLLWLATGLLFGAAVMVRPAFAFIGVVPLLYVLVTGRDWRRLLMQTGLLVAGFALVVSPWFVRNVVTLHKPIVLADHTGDPLLAGVDPYHWEKGWAYRYSGPTYLEYMRHHPFSSGPYAAGFDVTTDEYAMRALGRMLQENPASLIEWFTFGKVRSMFTRLWEGGSGTMASVTWVSLMAMVAFGLTGMVLSVKEERFRLLTFMILVGVASLLPFVPEPRYVFEFMPLLAVLAAGVMYRAWTLPET